MTLNIKQSLIKQLSTATLTTQLGSTAIYLDMIPQNRVMPAVTVQRISETPVHASIADSLVKATRFQISSWATSISKVETMAIAVESVLKDFSGNLGGAGGVLVQRIFLDNTVDLPDVDLQSGRITRNVTKDFIIWYTT